MNEIQVEKEHYRFDTYMTRRRWASIWSQLSTISQLSPNSTLEIGPGAGVLKAVGRLHGLQITTVDIDPILEPDHVAPITELPFEDETFELVCAFQVLEHLEFGSVVDALSELNRVTSKYALISLPNAQIVWRYRIYLPKFGERDFMF